MGVRRKCVTLKSEVFLGRALNRALGERAKPMELRREPQCAPKTPASRWLSPKIAEESGPEACFCGVLEALWFLLSS
jgi:hypothetical protein